MIFVERPTESEIKLDEQDKCVVRDKNNPIDNTLSKNNFFDTLRFNKLTPRTLSSHDVPIERDMSPPSSNLLEDSSTIYWAMPVFSKEKDEDGEVIWL